MPDVFYYAIPVREHVSQSPVPDPHSNYEQNISMTNHNLYQSNIT